MALPLLAAGVMGILGGGRWLMDKADKTSSEEGLSKVKEYIANNQETFAKYPGMTQDLLMNAESATSNFNVRDPYSRTRGVDNAMAQAQQLRQGIVMNEQNQLAEQGALNRERQRYMQNTGYGQSEKLKNEYQQDLSEFAGIQQQYKAGMATLENPSNINSVTGLYNLFNILEPGGRVTESEQGVFSGAGGAASQFANMLNKVRGDGLNTKTLNEIRNAIQVQYKDKYENAQRRQQWYDKAINQRQAEGLNIVSPIGSLGMGRLEGPAPSVTPTRGGTGVVHTPPKGMTTERPQTKARTRGSRYNR